MDSSQLFEATPSFQAQGPLSPSPRRPVQLQNMEHYSVYGENFVQLSPTHSHHPQMIVQGVPMPQTPMRQDRYSYPITPTSMHNRVHSALPAGLPAGDCFQNASGMPARSIEQQNVPQPMKIFPGHQNRVSIACDSAAFPELTTEVFNGFTNGHRSGSLPPSHAVTTTPVKASPMFMTNQFPPGANMGTQSAHGMRLDTTLVTPPVSPAKPPKKRKSPSKPRAKGRPGHLHLAIRRITDFTPEQLAAYMGQNPVPGGSALKCLYPGCIHTTNRKENIRAHVQTHLGDRPYECPVCHGYFVRSHDFTRHYATHLDKREFQCPTCPQGFNRADALQRHRERDFCNGLASPGNGSKVPKSPRKKAVGVRREPAARREKKQAARKETVIASSNASVDLTDDFYTSASSPEYFTSNPGSPETVLDDWDTIMKSQNDTSYTTFGTGTTASSEEMDKLVENFLGTATAGQSPMTFDSVEMAMSPPTSPEQTNTQITNCYETQRPLITFSPSSKPCSQERKASHEMTPPSSRDSMADFFGSLAPPSAALHSRNSSIVASPPPLSSASPSPQAFEKINDFGSAGSLDLNFNSSLNLNTDLFPDLGPIDGSANPFKTSQGMFSSDWLNEEYVGQNTTDSFFDGNF